MKKGALVLIFMAVTLAAPAAALPPDAHLLSDLTEFRNPPPASVEEPAWLIRADTGAAVRFSTNPMPASYSIPGVVAFLRDGNDLTFARSSQLLAPMRERLLSVRYDWRGITLEGATLSTRRTNEQPHASRGSLRSRGARLSVRPLPGLALHFSRGTWNYLDRFVAHGEMKRTSLSATYTKDLTGGEWSTTVAWGRSAQPGRDAVYGYLAESSIRFAGDRLAFGRLEEVGADELMSFGRLSSRHAVHPRKVSVGYFQDLHRSRAGQVGVGLMVSRYLVSEAKSAFPDNPTLYMLFMRVDMH